MWIKNRAVRYLACMGLLAAVGACKPGDESAKTEKPATTPTVYTTFYPTTYFAERIGGDHVKVVCPCPADADPAFWIPDDATIAAYQGAGLIVVNGASFEKWISKVSLPDSRVVVAAEPFNDDLIVLKDAVTHSHGPSGPHTHSGTDGHTWVDPVNARMEAQQIADAFARNWPQHADAFKQNMAALAADLDKLNARMPEVTAALEQRTLLCSHPAYNYLARRNGWELINFHLEPHEPAPAEEIEKIAKACADHKVALMLWEAEPLEESAKLLNDRFHVASVVYSPGETLDEAQRAAGADFLSIMNANVDRLVEALKAQPPAN
ncbi:MAG TPA: metal ABC transporter substrate-binding protein [Phycisphaerae bacterium]|nr:zinc ABC transporter substrate-binding protein [Phycisphaerales bacterium]HRX84697.1 metal ABC transporter substrate-binding protein [Phycisphaerae bacterium]